MANLNGFDAREVEPKAAFEPIPAGKYLACITASAMKPTNSGNGAYLEFQFQVLEGEHKGRLLWSRLNLENPKRETVAISRAELSAICRACGVMTPKDSVELHNLPLFVTVRVAVRLVKVAVTVLAASMFTVQSTVVPAHAPPHPVNVEFGSAAARRTTLVFTT